jgi:hypothetical protein
MELELTMKTLIATAFIATTAQAQVQTCTFEDLPEPDAIPELNDIIRASPIRNYEGFQFVSNLVVPANDERWQNFSGYWGYYAINDGVNFGGYDDGIVGDRALFTPYGAGAQNAFRISRENPWRFVGADITNAAWTPMTLTLTGYQDGLVNWTHTVTLQSMVRTRVEIDDLAIDTLKISGLCLCYSVDVIVDNLSYEVVPAPSALALLAIAVISTNRRRK